MCLLVYCAFLCCAVPRLYRTINEILMGHKQFFECSFPYVKSKDLKLFLSEAEIYVLRDRLIAAVIWKYVQHRDTSFFGKQTAENDFGSVESNAEL